MQPIKAAAPGLNIHGPLLGLKSITATKSGGWKDEINQAGVTQPLDQSTGFPPSTRNQTRPSRLACATNAAASRDSEAPAGNYTAAVLSSSGASKAAAGGVQQTDRVNYSPAGLVFRPHT